MFLRPRILIEYWSGFWYVRRRRFWFFYSRINSFEWFRTLDAAYSFGSELSGGDVIVRRPISLSGQQKGE